MGCVGFALETRKRIPDAIVQSPKNQVIDYFVLEMKDMPGPQKRIGLGYPTESAGVRLKSLSTLPFQFTEQFRETKFSPLDKVWVLDKTPIGPIVLGTFIGQLDFGYFGVELDGHVLIRRSPSDHASRAATVAGQIVLGIRKWCQPHERQSAWQDMQW